MKEAVAKAFNLRISRKNSLKVAKALKGMRALLAVKFLEDVIKGKKTINGKKYYTKTSLYFLKLLKNAISNAKQKNLNEEKLFIKTIKVNKGETIRGTKTRWKFRFRRLKSTHLEIVLEER